MALAAALLLAGPALAQHTGHTGHVGAGVMPFDLARSLHVFTPLPDGGTQDVVSRDGDAGQVELIRSHLRHEADAFARGEYGDPGAIHGADMPGLQALSKGAQRMRVQFDPIATGARLRFTSADPALVAALHDWFQAQLRDHGPDAVLGR